MKKRLTLYMALLSCFTVLIYPFRTFAYDANVYEHSEDVWYVTNYHDAPYTVMIKTVIQPEYYQYGSSYDYIFSCIDGNFSNGETIATMDYAFITDEKPVIELAAGPVFEGQFGLEDGTYNFMGLANCPVVIPFDFERSPFPANQEEYLELEKSYQLTLPIQLENKNNITLYVMMGDYDWAKENYQEFYDYCLETENNILKNNNPALFDKEVEEIKDENIEIVDEYHYTSNNQHEHIYTNSDGTLIKTVEDCTYINNICEKCKHENVNIVADKEKGNSITSILKLIGCGLILLVIFVIAKIRRR